MADKTLFLVGVSFRTAPASVRQSLCFNASEIQDLLISWRKKHEESEVAVLSTCNRSEFYLASTQGDKIIDEWLFHLRATRPHASILHQDCRRYQKKGESAARHLFEVACGLDSSILGDIHILGQIRNASLLALESQTIGKYLYRTMNQALILGKRARRETSISAGGAGIGSAVADLVKKRFFHANVPILILGAGLIAKNIGHHLIKNGFQDLTFSNRNFDNALELAHFYQAKSIPWEEFPRHLCESSIVIAATSSQTPIVTKNLWKTDKPKTELVIDAGFPANVDDLPIETITIDSLQEQKDKDFLRRETARPFVISMVEGEIKNWILWNRSLILENLIKSVYQKAQLFSQEAAQQLFPMDQEGKNQIEYEVFKSFKKILHPYIRYARHVAYQKKDLSMR